MCTSVFCFHTAALQNAEAAHGLLYTACLTDFNHLFYEWSHHLHTKRVSRLADICVSSLGLGVAMHKTRCHRGSRESSDKAEPDTDGCGSVYMTKTWIE